MQGIELEKEKYKNRELSWLQFNERVLNEAKDDSNPLFERLKFLSITASNLDEFFMIRVASLLDMRSAGVKERDIAGMTVEEQISEVSKACHKLSLDQYEVLSALVPLLSREGVECVDSYEKLSEAEKRKAEEIFDREISMVLSPVIVDFDRPFPLIRNDFIYVGGYVTKENKDYLALVQVPKGLKRVIEVTASEGVYRYILLEELIKSRFNKIFSGFSFKELTCFRVMRNADLIYTEEDAADLLSKIEKQVEKRERGQAIRLEIGRGNSERIQKILLKELSLDIKDLYFIDGPIDLTFLLEAYNTEGFEAYKKAEYDPVMPWEFEQDKSIFEQIKEHDLMLIHPFESFKPVVNFIEEAASDPDVLAIKQTLYRVSGNSPIVNALAKAAKNGKQVTVLVELKARFDEENNIIFARMLERAGCQVIYGFEHLKTHCKITLVIKRDNDGIKRYLHLGTGNYNDRTAKLYTDISFFTAKEEYGEDASKLFDILSGLESDAWFNKFSIAPIGLRSKFISLIEREAVHAENGRPAHIVAKLNSLCDKELIDKLYDASSRGVKIDLIVRGICCLRASVPGLSDNITVRSIIGNFLEHSRIYYFKNGGDREYYCSSADWMPRNMDKRIEILFPVERTRLCEKLNHVLKLMLKDNQKAWILQPDGLYKKMPDASHLYSFQEGFCEEEINLKR